MEHHRQVKTEASQYEKIKLKLVVCMCLLVVSVNLCILFPTLPGKSSTAAALAQHYGGASVSVDAVVTDVLTKGKSLAGLAARQQYGVTIADYAARRTQAAGEHNCMYIICCEATP